MKVNIRGLKRNCWHTAMELLIFKGRTLCDFETRTLINYAIAHNIEYADEVPEEVLDAIVNPTDSTYSKYEDDETHLVSIDRVSEVLMDYDLHPSTIDKIINELSL